MKRRWKVLAVAGVVLLAAATAPILTIETTCRSPIEGMETEGYRPLLKDAAWTRDETRTWLTYPEWYIVYSAESFAQHLQRKPPSQYPYVRDIRGFWSGFCAMNQAAAGRASGEAKIMLYTIGLSYSAEMVVKALYENTFGRLAEWIGGSQSAADRYAARVQQLYGGFMHERPWYEFPFGRAFSGLWDTKEPTAQFRHWERRLALSAEYGVKAGYAKLIGWASGASLGPDERTLRFVAHTRPQAIGRIDPRLKTVGTAGDDALVVEAPRYEQFTHLLTRLSETPVELIEISGNDDVFLTVLMPPGDDVPGPGAHLITARVDDPPGWRRVGLSTKVPELLGVMRLTRQYGGRIEHVYDY